MSLASFHPADAHWFRSAFDAATPAQAAAWAAIAQGRHTLVAAPTGSGKTLAAFLMAVDRLMFSPEPAPERRCRVLYISPLKALGADVARNLQGPVAEIESAALAAVRLMPPIRTALRTGDTTPAERAQQLKDIEWPERIELILNDGHWQVKIEVNSDGVRKIDVSKIPQTAEIS